MGEEKEKGRYWGKGYKIFTWQPNGNQMATKAKGLYKTRIFIRKTFIFNHFFAAFRVNFYKLSRECLLVVPSLCPLVVPTVVSLKNIIVPQIRINKGFERVR